MADSVSLHLIDLAVFALYMVVAVGLGLWVARKGKDTAQSYFLGNKTIPWFVVGASMVAADISSEQFISFVGGAYKYGIVLAAADWNGATEGVVDFREWVQPQTVEDRGRQILRLNSARSGVGADGVGGSVDHSASNTTAC